MERFCPIGRDALMRRAKTMRAIFRLAFVALSCAPFVAHAEPSVRPSPAQASQPTTNTVPANKAILFSYPIGADTLVIKSAPKFAGAISGLTYRGQEYVNDTDHGRLMQGAIAYDGLLECLNPTQGGGSRDLGNLGSRSTSKRLEAAITPNQELRVATRMAYWMRPNMRCTLSGNVRSKAVNKKRLSDDVYTITHRFGSSGLPQVVDVTIDYEVAGQYASAVVEALTIYTPPAFDTFHAVDPDTLTLKPEPTLTPDEQSAPIILSTTDGAHAIALLSRQTGATYARFRFSDTNKISLVYRETKGMGGKNTYQASWIIGTRDEVAAHLRTLLQK